jgi:hypothetical protein
MMDTSKGMYPHRVQILHQSAKLTGGQRDKTYGPPVVNLGLAGLLKRTFWGNATRLMSDAEREAIDQVLTKLARVGTGTYHEDNYIDGAAYFAIAGEVGALAQNSMIQEEAANAVQSALQGQVEVQPLEADKVLYPRDLQQAE